MYKSIETILFTTDLSKDCIPAYDFAMLLSLQFQAKIVLLHVKEGIPDYIEGRLKDMMGEIQWKDLRDSHDNDIRQALIGKQSSNKIIRRALEHLCASSDPAACEPKEIVIIGGESSVAETIIEQAKAHKCDIIVMGSNRGVISKQSVGSTVKSVMKHSEIPVVVVPYAHSIDKE